MLVQTNVFSIVVHQTKQLMLFTVSIAKIKLRAFTLSRKTEVLEYY